MERASPRPRTGIRPRRTSLDASQGACPTWGAERVTLVALQDGKKVGDAPGGTAHMVELAEESGSVHIKRIDATQLVK